MFKPVVPALVESFPKKAAAPSTIVPTTAITIILPKNEIASPACTAWIIP